jgi:hypothetical protein
METVFGRMIADYAPSANRMPFRAILGAYFIEMTELEPILRSRKLHG